MNSQRQQRCHKISHKSEAAVRNAITTNSSAGRDKNYAYYCRECKAWHLSRTRPGTHKKHSQHQSAFKVKLGEAATVTYWRK